MKFILNESNAKLILDERFVLTEADKKEISVEKDDAIHELKRYTDELKNSLLAKADNSEAVDKATTDYKNNQDIKDLQAKEKAASDAITKGDFGEVLGPVNQYTEQVRKVIQTVKNGNGDPIQAAPELNKRLGQLDAQAQKLQTDIDKTEKYDLLEKLEANFKSIAASINQAIEEAAKTAAPENSQENTDFINSVNNAWAAIAETEDKVNNLDDSTDRNRKALQALTTNITLPGKDNDYGNFIDSEISIIKDQLNKTTAACRAFARFYETAGEAAFNDKTKEASNKQGKKDWQQLFTNAGRDDPEAVGALWDQYYEEEWGSDAEKVKALGEAFTRELLNLGFTEANNPFITFIKYAFKNGINLNINNYPVIHNAYVKNYINDQDLQKTSPSASIDKNLLYCQSLYSKQPREMLRFLQLQRDCLSDEVYSKRVAALVEPYKDSYRDKASLMTGIVSSKVPVADIAKNSDIVKAITLSPNTNLRSKEELEIAYNTCFGEAPAADATQETKKDASKAKDLEDLVTKIKDKKLEDQAPSYVATRHYYETGESNLIKLVPGGLKQLTNSEIKTLAQIFKGYGNFTEKTLQALIDALKPKETK